MDAGVKRKIIKFFTIAFLMILLDQVSKILVYKNMFLGEEISVIGDWFYLHYLLNPGMAFGLKSDMLYGKMALTIFRILAMFGIGYYLINMIKKEAHSGLLLCLAFILGGAVGNVIDSTLYGVLLDNAPANAPTPWFNGQVIDMLYFPLFEGYFPAWFPVWANERFLFFSPVFNIADSSIFIGVVGILIWQKSFFKKPSDSENGAEDDANKNANSVNQEENKLSYSE